MKLACLEGLLWLLVSHFVTQLHIHRVSVPSDRHGLKICRAQHNAASQHVHHEPGTSPASSLTCPSSPPSFQPGRATCHAHNTSFCFMLHVFLKDTPVPPTWMPSWHWILCSVYLLTHSLAYLNLQSSLLWRFFWFYQVELVPSFFIFPLYHVHIYIYLHRYSMCIST